MAVTSIWKVKTRLDKVIGYVTNTEKTSINLYKDIYNDLHSSEGSYETEKQYLITGINCIVETCYKEMISTKKQYCKSGGILAYHAYQSFEPGEIDPRTAHEIGVKLAEEMWGDRFEVVICTHMNTDCIHNHFVINSVSFADGLRYYNNKTNYAVFRETSDNICEEYKKTICLTNDNYKNYYKGYIEKSNYHTTTKEDIDFAIAQAYNYQDFENILKEMNYELTYRAGRLSVKRVGYKKNIRLERSFGKEYSVINIKNNIKEIQMKRLPFPEATRIQHYYTSHKRINCYKKRGYLYRLYLYYAYLLKIYPNNNINKRLPPELRMEKAKMELISKEIRFVTKTKIDTIEKLIEYRKKLFDKYDILKGTKENLWLKHKKGNTEEKNIIINKISTINNKINNLRDEIKICKSIEERLPKLTGNLFKNEKVEGKEKLKNEPFR